MTAGLQDVLIWTGIALCLSQSALFSGLNLAMLGMSRLRLEVEASSGNKDAEAVLALRRDSNFLLTTILWGNVGINVLLTLLSDSVMAGVGAFLFSTLAITVFGEIAPQAYFSRHAMRMGALLAPLLRVYQFILYPVARPSAWVLDVWLGREGMQFFREHNLRELIARHISEEGGEINRIEGLGALNFLALDDLRTTQEGEELDARSILTLPFPGGEPVFPAYTRDPQDPFLVQVSASGKKWVVLVDRAHKPRLVLNANAFLRAVCMSATAVNPRLFAHVPIVVYDESTQLDQVLQSFQVRQEQRGDDVIDQDVVLLWNRNKRVLTGADILGRLLRGISRATTPGGVG